MYKWFLASRYLYTKLIALFGVASVMLCVAMVLVVLSVMGGFLDTVRERARGLHSEIILQSGSLQGFPFYDEFGEHLKKEFPDLVTTTTPVLTTYGIFRVPATNMTKPAQVLGIRLEEYVEVNDFKRGLHYEQYFPGTTHLGPQTLPVAGIDERGRLRLPPDLEEANRRWRAQTRDPKELAEFDARPFEHSPYPYFTSAIGGERVFAADVNPPRYAGPERPGVIVGADLLHFRRPDGSFDRVVARGADIALTLMPLSPSGSPLGEQPAKLLARYVDDSRTGIFDIDKMCAYVDFDVLQRVLAMTPQPLAKGGFTQPRANQLLIGIRDDSNLDAVRDQIARVWSDFSASVAGELTEDESRAMALAAVYTWEDIQRAFIAAVEKEKVLVTFLFAVISVVAIVLLGCIFYMIVEKKTKDIGILKAIGASSQGVAALFIVYAGAIGLVGSALGLLLGSTVVWNINDIQDFLASMNPQLRVWSPDVYAFDKIPNVVKRADAFWIAGVAVLSSIIGSLIPARIAGRVWPVDALRYE